MQRCHLLADRILVGEARLIIFAFDEAGPLCQGRDGQRSPRFLCLLEALTAFGGKVLGVFLDMSSKVRGYLPEESSGLPGSTPGRFARLFRPVYWFATTGILQAPPEVLAMLVRVVSESGAELLFCLPSSPFYSRVTYAAATLGGFWGATTAAERWAVFEMLAENIWKALALPERRSGHQDATARREEEEACLALSSIHWGVPSLGRADPDSCVARRLATITHVSSDGAEIVAKHLGEPMLAAAAAREMATPGCTTRLLRNLFGILRSGGASSIFSADDAGEFAAGVLLT